MGREYGGGRKRERGDRGKKREWRSGGAVDVPRWGCAQTRCERHPGRRSGILDRVTVRIAASGLDIGGSGRDTEMKKAGCRLGTQGGKTVPGRARQSQ